MTRILKIQHKYMAKIDVKSIIIIRREGPIHQCGIPKTFTTFADANTYLRWAASNIPHQGYDKHDVKITWADGQTYSGRYDITSDLTDTNIGDHIKQWFTYIINNPDQYNLKQRMYASEFLNTYIENNIEVKRKNGSKNIKKELEEK